MITFSRYQALKLPGVLLPVDLKILLLTMQNNTFRFVWAKLYWNSVAGTVHYCSKEILRVCRQQPFNDIFPSTLLATVSPPYIYILYVMVTFYHHKLISNAKFHLKKIAHFFFSPSASPSRSLHFFLLEEQKLHSLAACVYTSKYCLSSKNENVGRASDGVVIYAHKIWRQNT